MERHLKKLPIFVIDKIFSYYYNPQPKELLEDIQNYNKTLNEIQTLYYEFWIKGWPKELFTPPINQDKDWLINDIFAYANNDKASRDGYCEDFYSIWIRFLIADIWGKIMLRAPNTTCINKWVAQDIIQYREYIDSFIEHLEKKNSNTQIRIFWAALLPKQRDQFVKMKTTQIKGKVPWGSQHLPNE